MTHFQEFREQDRPVRSVEAADGVEFVVDLGDEGRDASVDVVGATAIVVTGDEQYEVALPDGDAEAFIRNGVLTVRTEEHA